VGAALQIESEVNSLGDALQECRTAEACRQAEDAVDENHEDRNNQGNSAF
jgi:hypothetical protein